MLRTREEALIFNIEDNLGFLISKTHQAFREQFKEQLNTFHLTPPQFSTLAFLWKEDGMSQAQLGSKLQIDRTTMSGILDRLEKQDLILRETSSEDRRLFLIYLTPHGKKLFPVIEGIAEQGTQTLTSTLSAEERELLASLLKRILKGAPHRGNEKFCD